MANDNEGESSGFGKSKNQDSGKILGSSNFNTLKFQNTIIIIHIVPKDLVFIY